VALDDELIDVLGFLVVEGLEREVIQDEQVDANQATQLLVIAGVEPVGL
jgi:hypothetical protein